MLKPHLWHIKYKQKQLVTHQSWIYSIFLPIIFIPFLLSIFQNTLSIDDTENQIIKKVRFLF